jgi:arabinan endo-1,5-alpha-L-arabinosidase
MKKLQYPAKPDKPTEKPVLGKRPPKPNFDPGMWLIHDPAIFQDDVTGVYYVYCTGAMCMKSEDLIHWSRVGKVVDAPPLESSEWVGSRDIWAPDIVKSKDEYRLYCSNSTWGVRQSCIFLAVSDNPEGPFIPRGCVLKTTDEMPVNAIDANIITDAKTREQYMVYGSFWGGCHVLRLDSETGLAAEEGIGVCVARRPKWLSAAIEGPYMIYNPETEYYYLFVSYGSLKSDYQIRVGRSKSITGPFTDFNGRDLKDDSDGNAGLMLFCGYAWNDGMSYMAPGHNSVLHNRDGEWYCVCHVREKNFTLHPEEPSMMQIRKIYWTKSGWPVLAAQPYTGEIAQEIPKEVLPGRYERINLVSTLPQGVLSSVPMKLDADGYYECCSIQGTWTYADGKLKIQYGAHEEEAFVRALWDVELREKTIAISGLSNDGVPFWAKKICDSNGKDS